MGFCYWNSTDSFTDENEEGADISTSKLDAHPDTCRQTGIQDIRRKPIFAPVVPETPPTGEFIQYKNSCKDKEAPYRCGCWIHHPTSDSNQ